MIEPLERAERMLADYAWTADVDDVIAEACEVPPEAVAQLRRLHFDRIGPDVDEVARVCKAGLGAWCERMNARRRAGEYNPSGNPAADVALFVLRERGARLHRLEGRLALTIGELTLACPSEELAREIQHAVFLASEQYVDDAAAAEAMELLAARVRPRRPMVPA